MEAGVVAGTERLHDSQSRETVKYDHESRGTPNQESVYWRGPASIQPSVSRQSGRDRDDFKSRETVKYSRE
jgi:hypothetical protein